MENQIFMEVLNLSLAGTVLGLLVLLVRPFTKRVFSRKWHYYLWLVVLFRLAVPVHLVPDIPVIPAADSVQSAEAETAGNGENIAAASEETGESSGDMHAAEEQNGAGAAAETEGVSAAGKAVTIEKRTWAGETGYRAAVRESAVRWLFLIWVFGAVLSLAVKLNDYQNFVRYMKADCVRVTDDGIQKLANTLAQEFHIRRWIWVYESPLVASPVLIGIGHPFIVLPKAGMSEAEARLVLRHELTHLKRHDLWYKWLYQLVLCIHWFNPFVYVLGRFLDKDCELSCDEAVIGTLDGEGRKSYGNLLLDTAQRQLRFRRGVLSVTLLEGKENLKERLQGILSFRKQRIPALILSFLLFAAAAALAACTPAWNRESGEESYSSASDSSKKDTQGSAAAGNATEEGGESGGFVENLVDELTGGSWKDQVLNSPFGISETDDAWRVYEDVELLAGQDVDGTWRAYFYSGGDGELTAETFAFCGSKTILMGYAEEAATITLYSWWTPLSGAFKLVHVKPDGSVETVTEDGKSASVSIELEAGRNAIKMAGREARLEQLGISFEGLDSSALSQVYYNEGEEEVDLLTDRLHNGSSGKEEFLSCLPEFYDTDKAAEAFEALLTQQVTFTAGELEEVFIYADEQKAGEALYQAVQNGSCPPLSGEQLMAILPYLNEDTAVNLACTLDKAAFTFEILQELCIYLDEEDCGTCLEHYLDLGNVLTYQEYGEIEYYLNRETLQRLEERLAGT